MTGKPKSALQIISADQIAALREAGFVVVHREPTASMAKAFYAKHYPENVSFEEGYHRAIAASIREQNRSSEAPEV